jgi:hypothetical protein
MADAVQDQAVGADIGPSLGLWAMHQMVHQSIPISHDM